MKNPKAPRIGDLFTTTGFSATFKVAHVYLAGGAFLSVIGHTLDGRKRVTTLVSQITLTGEVSK